MPGEALVLVGTTKGAYLLRSGADRAEWRLEGPWFAGRSVDAVAIDRRGGASGLLAGSTSAHWGPSVLRSEDLGRTWTEPEGPAIRFPADAEAALERVWQLLPGREDEPGLVRAGTAPAALSRSEDAGASFELVRGLWDHP